MSYHSENEPLAIQGYYPLYTTEEGANSASPAGSHHTHTLNGTTYYMPNGLVLGETFFHGDYIGVSVTYVTFPDPSQSPWTSPETGIEYYWDADAQAWVPGSSSNPVEETFLSVTTAGNETDEELTTGPTVSIGLHEVKANEADAAGKWTRWTQWKYKALPDLDNQSFHIVYSLGVLILIGRTGCYRSEDFGDTWQFVPTPQNGAYRVVTDGKGVIMGTSYNSSGSFMRSVDNGLTWTKEENLDGRPIQEVATDTNGTWIARGVYGTEIYKSTDNGASWTKIPGVTLSGGSSAGFIEYSNGYFLVAGYGSYEMVISTDSGNTWETRTLPYSAPTLEQGIFFSGDRWIYALTNYRYFESFDLVSWTEVQYIKKTESRWNIVFNGKGVLMTGNVDSTIVSEDNGVTWTAVNPIKPLPLSNSSRFYQRSLYADGKFVVYGGTTKMSRTMAYLEDSDSYDGWLSHDSDKVVLEEDAQKIEQLIENHSTEVSAKLQSDLINLPEEV